MTISVTHARPAACVFDAYGTLFDVGGAVAQRADVLGAKASALIARWREKQLQYTWLRSLQQRYSNFEQITADALDYALEELGVAKKTGLRDDLMKLYFTLPVYPDAERALTQLKSQGLRALILSNGTPAMLECALDASGIASLIDGVLSVESVGVYKPDRRVYTLAVEAVGCGVDRVAFVSSNAWDAYAGAAFGFLTIWCNRAGQPPERLPGIPSHQMRSLDELASCLGLQSADT